MKSYYKVGTFGHGLSREYSSVEKACELLAKDTRVRRLAEMRRGDVEKDGLVYKWDQNHNYDLPIEVRPIGKDQLGVFLVGSGKTVVKRVTSPEVKEPGKVYKPAETKEEVVGFENDVLPALTLIIQEIKLDVVE